MESTPTTAAASDPRPIKLKLVGVAKTFGNGQQSIEALQPTTMEIREGDFVIFFGPSGCGKSTLLNLVAGFETPSEGEISLDGTAVDGPHHERLMMFQEHGLFPWLNVIDNVSFGLKRKFRWKPKARRQRAREMLQMVHLEEFEKSAVHELSGGMKQRVAIARALAPDPKVLLVDEPFPALDAMTRSKLYTDLQEIFTRTRKTIILVTHDPREAACLGDRVVVFSGRPGKVKADIRIEIPRPRDINDPKVAEYATTIMNELEAAPNESPGKQN